MLLLRSSLVGLLGLMAAAATAADEPKLTKAEVAKRAKPAVAFVLAKVDARPGRPAGTAQGSAFCVHSSGLFVTTAHVVQGATEIELIVNPSLKDEKVLKAKVVRSNEKD